MLAFDSPRQLKVNSTRPSSHHLKQYWLVPMRPIAPGPGGISGARRTTFEATFRLQLVQQLVPPLVLGAEGRSLGATARAELPQDVPHVDFRSALCDPECPRDLFIRQPVAQETQNLLLSWGKRIT